jgi:hypothetical protein
MPPRYRWALLILALLFVLAGAYLVDQKTGGGVQEPGSKIITPIAPPRQREPRVALFSGVPRWNSITSMAF